MMERRIARVLVQVEEYGTMPDEMPHEERLVGVLGSMLGWDWLMAEWYLAEAESDTNDGFYELEFVFVPDTRTREERTKEFEEQASAALIAALQMPESAAIRAGLEARFRAATK